MNGEVITGAVVVGAFLLVFVVVPVILIFADGVAERLERWWKKNERRIKRELTAKWLNELHMTAIRMPDLDDAGSYYPVRVDAEEMMAIINRN